MNFACLTYSNQYGTRDEVLKQNGFNLSLFSNSEHKHTTKQHTSIQAI